MNMNLLPWRKFEREYQVRMLRKIFVLTVSLAVLIIMAAHLFISHQESSLQARIDETNKKLTIHHEGKSQNGSLINDMSITNNKKQQQQDKNTFALRFFSELGKKYQEKVCFTDIEQLEKTLMFSGKAHSMHELTGFLRHWNAVYLFNEIEIKLIEEQENGFVQFKFQARE